MTWSLSIPIIIRKNETKYTHTMYVHIHDTNMYTQIFKYRSRKYFMTNELLFNIQNKSFYDRVISIVR